VLGDDRLEVVVDDARLHDAGHVVPVDLQHPVHPREVEHDAPVDRVGAAREACPGPARDNRDPQRRAGAHDTGHLLFGTSANPEGGTADGRPFGIVMGDGSQDVWVDNEPVSGDLAGQRLDNSELVMHG
jgi:hypothetical protein